MTYGWALVIVVISLGSLLFYLNGDETTFATEHCFLGPGLGCSDATTNEDSITINVINSMGRDIGHFIISSENCEESSKNLPLRNNEEATFILKGCTFEKGDLIKESAEVRYSFLDSSVEHIRTVSLLQFVGSGVSVADIEFDMTVHTDQIVKDIHGLTKGFGTVTHAFLHPKFLEAYITEVGVEGVTIRLSHKTEDIGRMFPQPYVHNALVANGAKVMVFIKGVPAEEGIAHCAEYSGSDCISYEPNGPAKDLEAWKAYVKDVVSFYNSKGVKYFIIWNEPNYEIENWREVCSAPNDCWMPTMEEFLDMTISGVEAIKEVNPLNEAGVGATAGFFGRLYFENGTEAVVSLEVFEALKKEGLEAHQHFHYYKPDPYTFVPGGREEQAMEQWKSNKAYLGSNLDEFSDGLEGMASINGDGIYASSSAMAVIANAVNFDIDNIGWFQLNSDTHEPGTIEGIFLGWDENMIDRSGVFKPVFWLSKLLHEAPGTLLVEDDLDESGIVRAFVVRNEEGTSYCMYAVNFNTEDKSAMLNINIKGLPTNLNNWNYKTYRIGKDDGNPYQVGVEGEIESLLDPIILATMNTPGKTWKNYINDAWPTLAEINNWESVRPTETVDVVSAINGEISSKIILKAQDVVVLCIEAVN